MSVSKKKHIIDNVRNYRKLKLLIILEHNKFEKSWIFASYEKKTTNL